MSFRSHSPEGVKSGEGIKTFLALAETSLLAIFSQYTARLKYFIYSSTGIRPTNALQIYFYLANSTLYPENTKGRRTTSHSWLIHT